MGTKANRQKMKRAERAKQFAPFAALKGFEEAIAAREKIIAAERVLDDDKKDELDRLIRLVNRGNIIRVVYRVDDEYLELTGMVSRVDIDGGYIKVIYNKIYLSAIYDLEIIE